MRTPLTSRRTKSSAVPNASSLMRMPSSNPVMVTAPTSGEPTVAEIEPGVVVEFTAGCFSAGLPFQQQGKTGAVCLGDAREIDGAPVEVVEELGGLARELVDEEAADGGDGGVEGGVGRERHVVHDAVLGGEVLLGRQERRLAEQHVGTGCQIHGFLHGLYRPVLPFTLE